MSLIYLIKRKIYNLIHDDSFSEILTGSVWALCARLLATALALASTIIIARVFGPEMMGVVALVNSFVAFITIFTLLGTNTSILRLIPEHISKHSATSAFKLYKKTSCLITAVALAAGLLLWVCSPLIARKAFSKPYLSFYLALAAGFLWAKSLLDFNTQAIRALRRIRQFCLIQILPPAAMLIFLALGAALIPTTHATPVYAQLAAWALSAALGSKMTHTAFQHQTSGIKALCTPSVHQILMVSLPMLLTSSMAFLIGQTGTLILGMLRPVEEVGYYSAAVKLSSLTLFVLTSINSMAAPKFADLYQAGKITDLFHVARKSTKLIFWATTPILVALIILGDPILTLLYGQKFRRAYLSLLILSLGQFVNSISGATGHFMNMTGNQNTLLLIMAAAAAANILLSAALIPYLGAEGAALAGATSTALWNVACLLAIGRKYGKTIAYIPYKP